MNEELTLRKRSEEERRAYAEGYMAGVRYMIEVVTKSAVQAKVVADLMERLESGE